MKRALLIAGGTVGGLGAVLSITPPQLGSSGISTLAGASADTSTQNNSQTGAQNSAAVSATPSTAPSKAATNSKTSSNTSSNTSASTKKSTATKQSSASKNTNSSSTSNNSNSNSTTNSDNTAVATPAPAPAGVTGSFTGDVFNVSYGNVQVKITVANGKIVDAVALQAPSGRNQRYTDYAIPNLRQQTLSAQSAAISGVGGASYTSYGWYKSLITALQKAGMSTGV